MMDAEERELFAKGIQHATRVVAPAPTSTPRSTSSAGGTRSPPTRPPRSPRCSSTRAPRPRRRRRSAWCWPTALGVDARRIDRRRPPAAGSARRRPAAVATACVRGVGLAALAGQPRRAWSPTRRWRAHRRRHRALDAARRSRASTPRLGLARGHRRPLEPVEAVADAGWPEAVAAGQRALAHELVGASRTMLALAREHAARPRPVRPPHRRLPGRPPPPGRQPRRHRSRRRRRARGVGRRHAAHRRARQGGRRSQRPHRRPPRPAGAGRHRLHHRALAAPLRPPRPRARPPPRRRPRRSPQRSAPSSSEPAACRRSCPSDGAVTGPTSR